ncbi:MAG: glycosyltransferase family 4 protein [Chthoniobacteraceae bacterium]
MPDPAPTSPLAAITGGLLLGGSTTFLLNLLRGARALGEPMPVVVSFSEPNEHRADFERLGADVWTVDARGMIYEDRIAWAYRQVAPLQPACVIACLGSEGFELLRLAPPGVRRIGVIQSHEPGTYAVAARYAPWVDAMVGVSEQVCAALRAMPEFAGKPVHSIPYGIDFAEAVARPERSEADPLRVIYLGRMIEEQKRVSRLAALARKVDAPGAPIRFTLVGSGPQEAGMRAQTAPLGSVTMTGAVPNERVAGILREHDVFVLLSDYEGLPLSLLEAMGEGVVPVVSDLPSGIAEAVPEGCGVRVPVGDVDAAAAALRGLAADPARLAALSRAASEFARTRFSARRMTADYLALAANVARSPWPERVKIPRPIGLGWMFSGWARGVRRVLKRLAP